MSELNDDDQYDDEEDQQEERNSHIRTLREKAKERDRLVAELADRNRELAFAKAKLDLDDPRLKYFIKGYEGDLTPDAIRQQAEADGFLPRQESSGNPEELSAQQRIANASSGAGETPNPDLNELFRNAQSVEEVMKIAQQAGLPTSWAHE